VRNATIEGIYVYIVHKELLDILLMKLLSVKDAKNMHIINVLVSINAWVGMCQIAIKMRSIRVISNE
jgi:hypothetical protein